MKTPALPDLNFPFEVFLVDQLVVPHKGISVRLAANQGRAAIITDDLPRVLKILSNHGGFAEGIVCLGGLIVAGGMGELDRGMKLYRTNALYEKTEVSCVVLAKDSGAALYRGLALFFHGLLLKRMDSVLVDGVIKVVDLRVEQLLIVYPEDAKVEV
jgi:hypothetical protein